ncbi:hypothetical protein GCM10010532_096900 [Dactylosporangium siamense]
MPNRWLPARVRTEYCGAAAEAKLDDDLAQWSQPSAGAADLGSKLARDGHLALFMADEGVTGGAGRLGA